MSYAIYTTQAAAQAALDAVNAAFVAFLQAGSITQCWCDSPTACVEGWAIPMPKEPFRAQLGDCVFADQITIADQFLPETNP